jgi:hypothetical protein
MAFQGPETLVGKSAPTIAANPAPVSAFLIVRVRALHREQAGLVSSRAPIIACWRRFS